MKHECNRDWAYKIDNVDKSFYGSAVGYIEKIDSAWYAHNCEYATKIKYCPFCGQKLEE